jgi:putative transposase
MPKPWTFQRSPDLYFCTDVIVGWQYVFTSPEFFDSIIDSWNYCQINKGLRLHAYVIIPNHLQMIMSASARNPSDIMRDFKRHTSQQISDLLAQTNNNRLLHYFSSVARREGRGNTFKIWDSGSHPKLIDKGDFLDQKLRYIHDNPVRKGYVENPEHWKYSSARNYIMKDHSIIKVELLE